MTKKKKTSKLKVSEGKEEIPLIPTVDELEQTEILDDGHDMSGVTVQELEKMIQEYYYQKGEVEEAEGVVKRLKEVQVNTERRLLSFLNEFDKTSYKSTWGTLVKTGRYSWKTPKTPETRELFFNFLKEREVYDSMISVNSNTLASFAKAEMKEAEERQDIDFAIPGLDEPTYTERVSLRKR